MLGCMMFFAFCLAGISVWAIWQGLERYAFLLVGSAVLCALIAIDHEMIRCLVK